MKISALALCLILLAAPLAPADAEASPSAAGFSTSDLMNQALDARVGDIVLRGNVLDVIQALEDRTGVRIEADPAVWDALPWGSDTTLTCHFQNVTLRRALGTIARRLGLSYSVGNEAVEFTPSPPLSRLGRRATLDEVHVLDVLASQPFNPVGAESQTTVRDVLETVDTKLRFAGSPFATSDQAFGPPGLGKPVDVAANATLMDAMEDLATQTNATWYPWGRSLVVVKKIDCVRQLLAKRVNRNYENADLQQVLIDMSEVSGVQFHYEPGVLQKVPPQYRKVTLKLEDATVDQTLSILSGATGLQFTPTDDGVNVSYGGR